MNEICLDRELTGGAIELGLDCTQETSAYLRASLSGPLGTPSALLEATSAGTVLGLVAGPLGTPSGVIEASLVLVGAVSGPLGSPTGVATASLKALASVPSPLGSPGAVATVQPILPLLRGMIEGPLGNPQSVATVLPALPVIRGMISSPLGATATADVFVDLDQGYQYGYGFGTVPVALRSRGMMLITPGTIIKEMLVSSTAETSELPLWNETQCYRRGEQVRTINGRMWEALYNSSVATYNKCLTLYNIGMSPAYAMIPSNTCKYVGEGEYWWKEIILPSNEMRMFDFSLETETVAVGPLIVEVAPQFPFNGFAVFGVTAKSVKVWMGTKYYRRFDLEYENPLFDSVLYKDSFVETNLPQIDGMTLKFEFEGVGPNLLVAAGTVKVGVLAIGMRKYIGLDCYQTEVGITDYSKKDRDVFGLPVLVEDTYSDRVNYIFEAQSSDLYRIRDLFSEHRAMPTAYIGYSPREETHVFGLYQDFRIPIDNVAVSTGTLEVLGMPAYWDKPYDDLCFPYGAGKTAFVCGDTSVEACYEEGACQAKTVTLVCGNQDAPISKIVSDFEGMVLTVGVNGALFFNGKRGAFSPWDSNNYRSAAYMEPILWNALPTDPEVWCVVGDGGLIQWTTDRKTWVRAESPLGDLDLTQVVSYRQIQETNVRVFMATSSCFKKRVYSFDRGVTWKEQDPLLDGGMLGSERNIFDTFYGVNDQNEELVDFGLMRVFASGRIRPLMAGEGGVVHYLTGLNYLWQTVVVPDVGCFIDAAVGDRYSMLITKDLIAWTGSLSDSTGHSTASDWSLITMNPFGTSELVSISALGDLFYLASADGRVMAYAGTDIGIVQTQPPQPARIGTLSQLGVNDMLKAIVDPGVPGG